MYNGVHAMKLEVNKIGNSTGLILPKELLAKLNLKQGEWLNVTGFRRFILILTRR